MIEGSWKEEQRPESGGTETSAPTYNTTPWQAFIIPNQNCLLSLTNPSDNYGGHREYRTGFFLVLPFPRHYHLHISFIFFFHLSTAETTFLSTARNVK